MFYFFKKKVYSFLKIFTTTKKRRIVILGLDNCGKTTFLNLLKFNSFKNYSPTMHPNNSIIKINNLEISMYDMGGHKTSRKLWNDYIINVDAIIFIVDSSDISRISESSTELHKLLDNIKIDIPWKPILVFGNKIDVNGSPGLGDFKRMLNIEFMTTGKDNFKLYKIRPLEVFMCSFYKKLGLKDGLDWLTNILHN